MPFTIKTTFYFAGWEQGWEEEFLWVQNTDNLDTALAAVLPIAQKRARLLARDYTLNEIRCAVVVDGAGEKVLRVSQVSEPRLPGVQAWDPAQPNVALLARWYTADKKKNRPVYMRGCPAGLGDHGKKPDETFGGWRTNWNAYVSALVFFHAGWFKGTITQACPITSFTVDAVTARVSFVLNGGFTPWPVAFNKQCRVYVAVPGRSPLDGALVVVPTDATHCFTPQAHPASIPAAGQFGQMSIRTPSLVTLDPIANQGLPGTIIPQRMVTRKTGRPSYASRGRVRGKALW